jgi:hypothetical protein
MIDHPATLAQLVEQLIRNQQVTGSSPVGGSVLDSFLVYYLPYLRIARSGTEAY